MAKKCPVRNDKCWGDGCLWWDGKARACYVVSIGTRKPSIKKSNNEVGEDIRVITGIPRPDKDAGGTILIKGVKRKNPRR
jgi:hypothetical protein